MCMFPTNSECLIGISDAFSGFCLRAFVIFPACSLYHQQKRAYSALHLQAWTYIYRSMLVGTYRVQSPGFPKIVYLQSKISEIYKAMAGLRYLGTWQLFPGLSIRGRRNYARLWLSHVLTASLVSSQLTSRDLGS